MKNKIRRIEHLCGIEYISEKKEKRKFVFFVLFIFSLYYMYYIYTAHKQGYLTIDEFQILLFFLYILLIITYLNNYSIEKLLLINNIGIQIEKENLFKHHLKFICANDIKSVFINEVIYIFEISPYLCLTLKNNNLIVVFEDFNLEMKNLVNIYRDIKKTFFFDDYKKLTNVKAEFIKNEEESITHNDTYSAKNNSSSEENIFKMLNITSCENFKINNQINFSPKKKTFDIYINKKLALEIMNN
ncbi:phosphatidylinositol N-acetylglucosaminyltransferase subunit H, putative [Plasmodium gallinaceum]|uniref:Phosphatidylinositol N-acetylglucosaminyltransferase subunit H, putative n=1 Tax=Plasmodium gallinaceum TaxID=5849 RepID=A0A1J1GYT5_PLAGA|nr:phosphatidylinositol N-acetylglucosaminyltransferase subunit H, putative [Plasmodium gallinaceum]CRG96464.1 phosphatidylinositol N-acetylglucosaminyltransferase subunit H, putative [Plasmodium gallinaceum]